MGNHGLGSLIHFGLLKASVVIQKQWLVKHKMSFLPAFACFLGRRAHEKPFVKTLLMILFHIHDERRVSAMAPLYM